MPDKPKKTRRTPVNSPAGVSAAIVAGGRTINVPSHVKFDDLERLIFAELITEMSKSEITDHKVTMMVLLARQMACLQNEQVSLAREGVVLTNSHGNAVANPRVKICAGLTAAILAMRRSLGIHARELAGGDNRRTAIMREHNKANEVMMDEIDGDNLLARPNVVPLRPQEGRDDR